MAWYSDYQYRKLITITGQTGAGIDCQVRVAVGESSGASDDDFHVEEHSTDFPSAKNDSGDLRFTDNDGETLLPFWVESVSGITPNRTAIIWVKVSDNLDSDKDIYCYYGKIGASNVSNGEDTFIFFDEFANLDNWTTIAGSPSTDGDIVTLGGSTKIRRTTTESRPIVIDFYGKFSAKCANTNWAGIGFGKSTDTDRSAKIFTYNNTFRLETYDGAETYIDISDTTGSYRIYTLKINSTASLLGFDNYSSVGAEITTHIDANLNDICILQQGATGITLYCDWVRTRKFVVTEPSFSTAEAEEESSATIQKTILSDAVIKGTTVEKTILSDAKIKGTIQQILLSDANVFGNIEEKTILSDAKITIYTFKDILNKINIVRRVLSNLGNRITIVKKLLSNIDNNIRTKKSIMRYISNDIRFIKYWQRPGDAGTQSLGKSFVKVYIATVENTYAIVDSISINKSINTVHTASFELGLPYDSPLKPTLEALVEIKYHNWKLYRGYITSITPTDNPEQITINCSDEFWKENKTKTYFMCGEVSGLNQTEKYIYKIKDALSQECGFNVNIGNFVPNTINCFAQGKADTINSLIQACGNYGFYYDETGTKILWTGGVGDIVTLEAQQLGENLSLYHVLNHRISTSVENLINKFRVQMGAQTIQWRSGNSSQAKYDYYEYREWAIPDWDASYEKLAITSNDGYGLDNHNTEDSDKYDNVFRVYRLPELNSNVNEKWSDKEPPTVELYFTSPWVWGAGQWKLRSGFDTIEEVSQMKLTKGFHIDFEKGQIIFDQPIYGAWINDEWHNQQYVHRVNIIVTLAKEITYPQNTEGNELTVTNPLMFFTEKIGDYPDTIIGNLNLSNCTIGKYSYPYILQCSDTIKTKTEYLSFNDMNFAKDIANWELSKICDTKTTGTTDITLDAACFYNIDLNKRIRIDGVLSSYLNITNISYNLSNFTVTLTVENFRPYKRTVSTWSRILQQKLITSLTYEEWVAAYGEWV